MKFIREAGKSKVEKFLRLDKHESGETHTSFPLVGTG